MKPNFRIKSKDKDLTEAIRSRLVKLTVKDEACLKSDKLCIELADDPPIALPEEGQVFEVALGYEDVLVDIGSYATKHVAISGAPRVLKIEASALDQSASIKSQREQSWSSTTLGRVVGEIARRNGLKPAVIDELQNIAIEYETQTESDIQFLNRLARRYDMIVKISDRFLMVSPADKSQKASGGTLPKISVTNPIKYEYSGEQTKRYTGVRAYWYDNDAAKKNYVLVGKQGVVLELEFNKVTEDSARRAAEAKFREVSRKGKTLTFTVPGDCALAAERKCSLSGVREGVDGEWVIKSVEHVIDGSTFQSTVECTVDGYKETKPDPADGEPEQEAS